MNSLRAELEATCRRLGSDPVEPLFMLSRDEKQLLSPIALKLGLDPAQVLGSLPGHAVGGMLVLEPEYAVTSGPLVGLSPRWEALFRMARSLTPAETALDEQDRALLRYVAWRQAGLGSPVRLASMLEAYYEKADLLRSASRLELCRAALSTLQGLSTAATASAAG